MTYFILWSTKLNRQEKQLFIENLRDSFNKNAAVFVVKQNALSVSEVSSLRKKLFELNASYKVVKNTLSKVAIKDSVFEVLGDAFTGPTAIAFADDPVSVAKVLSDFAKEKDEKFVVVSGFYNGSYLSKQDIITLATLPSIDEIKSKIIAVIKTPSQNVFSCVRGVPEKLARVVNEFSKK